MPKNIPVDDFTREEAELSFKYMSLGSPSDYSNREPHRHNYYEIFHFINGGGDHMIDFNHHEIKDNSLHFVSPGQVHMLRRDPKAKGSVIIFSRDFFYLHSGGNDILSDYPAFNKTSQQVITAGKDLGTELLQLCREIDSEFSGKHVLRDQILYNYTSIFLLKCRPAFPQEKKFSDADTASQHIVKKFLGLIEDHFTTLHKVSDYADKLNITPNHLNDVSKRATGKTALELIQQRVLLEAKRQLLHSDLNSKEISFLLNFSDPSYFSRFFKQHAGLSPELFRKQSREKYQQ